MSESTKRVPCFADHFKDEEDEPMSTNLRELLTLRTASEYHEDMGPVLWWMLPITEPPYVGGPNDCGYAVELHTMAEHIQEDDTRNHVSRIFVGGWPGYHTHWSPIPSVVT